MRILSYFCVYDYEEGKWTPITKETGPLIVGAGVVVLHAEGIAQSKGETQIT